jgi:hypothetical protein
MSGAGAGNRKRMSSDSDATTTPEYHALFGAFETAQADWDQVRPEDGVRDVEPDPATGAQRERFARYRDAVEELNGYRLRKGLGAL